ncbi:aminoglycoside phosphotransferase family protein [Streptomyces sp. NBC_01381]|uniref:phosphotransferase family protein n=1 Tax=Streptomyces sp. NBC_01381 TaxID=2903845 RepID=UPI002253F606|nr:aminoglycoside phosphotransferase family protein [Streptomyces sp. NBC_01381]MCX4666101.1 aminoglycoside phosphotransferase family protein [Streptomyces sp. NBC_01381]
MSSPLHRRAQQALVCRLVASREAMIRRLAASHRERPNGEVVTGHHNSNYIVPLGWWLALFLGTMPFRARAKCRTPLQAVEVVPRIWPSEAEILKVVTRHLKEVPRCLVDFGDWSIHAYMAGRPLSEAVPDGPVGEKILEAFADFFARKARVPESELPARPDGWPEPGDSQGFLEWLVDFTEGRVHRPNRGRFDMLFEEVGIRPDAMTKFTVGRPKLTPRPFCLLHTDVHRANVVVDLKRIAVIDWELALFGDPLHDLATHLVRMDYSKDEQVRMRELWVDAMEGSGHSSMAVGLDTDLPVYLDFEYAQSVFPDIMRASISLPAAPDVSEYAGAARQVCRALRRAVEPLALEKVPDKRHVVAALRAWHSRWYGRSS